MSDLFDLSRSPQTTAPAPLVIAAHGTRDAAGEQAARDLAARVQRMLPDVEVSVGFVELSLPSVTDALRLAVERVAAGGWERGRPRPRVVVVPLMLGTGNHVRVDIPGFIDEVRQEFPSVQIDYGRHLGPEPVLQAAVEQRLDSALAEWSREDTTLVFCGRGALVPEANADHVRLSRLLLERGGWKAVEPCFIQVTHPSLPEGLDAAHARGARQLVVMGHWMFPGRLRTWTFHQAEAWAAAHPDTRVRVADVIGDCDELAQVVVARYKEMRPQRRVDGSPTYVSGLLLEGRDVLVVGGGSVAERRVPVLVEAGARVHLVAPVVTAELAALADRGMITWKPRKFEDSDLDGVWYAMAATDDPVVNQHVAEGAEARHTFCVRADDAWGGSAWTPATSRTAGATVAVISNRNPRLSRAIRDRIHMLLEEDTHS